MSMKEAVPNAEAFFIDGEDPSFIDDFGFKLNPGWYYHFRYQGFPPENKPQGPHCTKEEALEEAVEDWETSDPPEIIIN